jgi:hypothetical protein
VKVAERRFAAHQLGFLSPRDCVPEMNPLAAGMAGATRTPPGRYIAIATVSDAGVGGQDRASADASLNGTSRPTVRLTAMAPGPRVENPKRPA